MLSLIASPAGTALLALGVGVVLTLNVAQATQNRNLRAELEQLTEAKTLVLSLAVVLLGGMAALQWQRVEAGRLRQALDTARATQAARREKAVEARRPTARPAHALAANAPDTVPSHDRGAESTPAATRRLSRLSPGGHRDPVPLKGRDPEQGFVRLENFADVGQATPSAAFQTAIWAVTKGNYEALAPLLTMSPDARARLQQYLDGLPRESRQKFGSPEQVIGLLMAMDILKNDALQIAGTVNGDRNHATIDVRRHANGKVQASGKKRIPLERGPSGWRLSISDAMMDDIPSALAQASLYLAPPK